MRFAGSRNWKCQLVRQRQPDIIQRFQQGITLKVCDLESSRNTVSIGDSLLFPVDRDFVKIALACSAKTLWQQFRFSPDDLWRKSTRTMPK